MRGLIGAVLLGATLVCLATGVHGNEAATERVVFVCEHGAVKSVIAMLWFNKLAVERGLEIRAISRGVTPDNAVPQTIADHLAKDGLQVGMFKPKAFAKDDLVRAVRVVAIGVDTAGIKPDAHVPIETWDDIPAATRDYRAARDAMRVRIERLFQTSLRPDRPK